MTRQLLPAAALTLLAGATMSPTASALSPVINLGGRPDRSIDQTIAKVEQMPWDGEVTTMASRHGLSVVNVTWEDTGRYKGSSVGPNISDMTIGVRDSHGQLHPMPVFRFDNFNDETADIRSDRFYLSTGNESGDELRATSLEDLLKDTRSYLHDEDSWEGRNDGLWDSRDSHVLVSAQACFLPIPKTGAKAGEAVFTPVLYNYQSYPGNPAVLTMVATRQGTSIQVIENDGGYMSEPLFFNADGERAPFTAERMSDHLAQGGSGGGPVTAGNEDGNDVVLVIQVPLKQKQQARSYFGGGFDDMSMAESAPAGAAMDVAQRSDVEAAVIGFGEAEGPFKEINDLAIERDDRFPVRVTVQFYKATSNGVVSDEDVAEIRERIDRVYNQGDYVGSLVSDGYTGRPTEWVSEPTVSDNANWATPAWQWLKAF